MRLKTLGGVALTDTDFQREKLLLLLAYLAVEGPRTRHHLRDLFWPDATHPATNMRMAVSRLRVGAPDALGEEHQRLVLRLPSDVCDLSAALRNDPQRAPELYTGAFLDGLVLSGLSAELEEWVMLTREHFAVQVRSLLIGQAVHLTGQGQHAAGVDLAERAWRLPGAPPAEPDELRTLHMLLGSSTFGTAVRGEAREFGLVLPALPSVSSRQATPLVTGSETSGECAVPSQLTVSGLLVPRTAFVGRDTELQEIRRLLLEPQVRVLTLFGPGGNGKTRLAMQLARSHVGRVAFVGLETVLESDQVAAAIARSLEIPFALPEEAAEALHTHIGSDGFLLVLDNFEQVLEAGGMLNRLILACPGVKLLVTSRSPLNLTEEVVYPVGGLQIAGSQSDAVQLFLGCARRADARFRLTDQNLPSIVQICERVDGLPLGIELAAAWVRKLSVPQLLVELERSPDLLENATAPLDSRHRSVRQVFEQSWAQLTGEQQNLLSGLSVFVGGFPREAAAEVMGATLPQLLGLVDASFLKLGADGRFDRHPLLSAYIREKFLAQPESAANLASRHAEYYERLSSEAYLSLYTGVHYTPRVQWLQDEYLNILTALDTSRADGHVERSLWLSRNLVVQWYSKRLTAEARRTLQSVLTTAKHLRGTAAYAWCLFEIVALHLDPRLWDDRYSQLLEEAVKTVELLSDGPGINRGYFLKGQVARIVARAYTDAELCYREAIRAADIFDLTVGQVEDRFYLANLKVAQLELGEAQRLLAEALRHAETMTADIPSTGARAVLGRVLMYQGKYDEAAEVLLSTEQAFGAYNFTVKELFLNTVGTLFLERSFQNARGMETDLAQAEMYFQRAVAAHQGYGSTQDQASPYLGEVMLLRGEFSQALEYARTGLQATIREDASLRTQWFILLGRAHLAVGSPAAALEPFQTALHRAEHLYLTLLTIELIAVVAAAIGQVETAAQLLAATGQFRLEQSLPLAPVRREQVETARADLLARLSSAQFQTVWASGLRLQLHEAKDLALEFKSSSYVSVAEAR